MGDNSLIKEAVKLPEGIKRFVCSSCTQRLLSLSQEERKKAHQLALQKDMPDKAAALKSFFQEKENDSETGTLRKHTIRKTPLRMVKH